MKNKPKDKSTSIQSVLRVTDALTPETKALNIIHSPKMISITGDTLYNSTSFTYNTQKDSILPENYYPNEQ